jgi:eukaryotic-like serine/threonine-protein kinase
MGAVYEASHHVTGKRFALKWLMPELTSVHGAVERFIREAQIGAQFEHPNLVEVYDIGQAGGSLYIVMELLEGEPLSERLARVLRLTPRAACELLCPCMEAVALAHEAGVIHRDLKPGNIFVCRSSTSVPEHARVLDFGVSKLASGSQLDRQQWTTTTPGVVLGTPHYMAPEQMRGEHVDARADVYAFGVILYEVLSGEPPFQADSFADLVVQVLTEAPRSLDRLAALPEGLAEIVAKAMAREPADRFDSIAALLDALAPYRAGRFERCPTILYLQEPPAAQASRRCEVPAGGMSPLRVVERAEVPRPPRSSNVGSIAAFVAALAFVVAGTWATRSTPEEQALETSEAALEDLELAEEPDERALEPKASSSTKVREIEAVADARDATKAARAARDPERRAIPPRRTTPTSPAQDTPPAVRASPSPDTLTERPITIHRLSNGLIDPFDAR